METYLSTGYQAILAVRKGTSAMRAMLTQAPFLGTDSGPQYRGGIQTDPCNPMKLRRTKEKFKVAKAARNCISENYKTSRNEGSIHAQGPTGLKSL